MTLSDFKKLPSKFLNNKSIIVGSIILITVVLYALLYTNVKPKTYKMNLFSISKYTIRAPKTVEDTEKTKEERERAASSVEDVYVRQDEQTQNRVSLVSSIFDFIEETQKEKKQSNNEKLSNLKNRLSENAEDVTQKLDDQSFITLLSMNPNDLQEAKNLLTQEVQELMKSDIKEDDLTTYRDQLEADINQTSYSKKDRQALVSLGKYAIHTNYVFDETETDKRKKQAMSNVEPTRILQGQVIVQEGHIIDRDTYRQLNLLGLINKKLSPLPYIGLFFFVVIAVASISVYSLKGKHSDVKLAMPLFLSGTVLLVSILFMKMIHLTEALEIENIQYLFPVAFAPLVLRLLLNEKIALLITIILAACGSIVFHSEMNGTMSAEMAIYILIGGLTGIISIFNKKRRVNILWAGFTVSVLNILTILSLSFLNNTVFTRLDYLTVTFYAFVSGILSAILTLGFLPFFEMLFGMLSSIKLLELSNPNHPLMKKLLTEAPGTYHHSLMVANLAEAACEAIGANGLLARTACYYHDLGKTKHPQFFIENQMQKENPHDSLSPYQSRDIILAHTTDGADLLRKYKLPKPIIDIAEQHHGTTCLYYFYTKAKEKYTNVNEESFRYAGPKPQTKEAAIINIADSVEAAVRSMSYPTSDQIKQLIGKIVQGRLTDGQLNECDITLKEIETVKKTFCETLNGIFHSRIEYPSET